MRYLYLFISIWILNGCVTMTKSQYSQLKETERALGKSDCLMSILEDGVKFKSKLEQYDQYKDSE